MQRPEYVDYLLDVLSDMGHATSKRLFSGWDIRIDGEMVGAFLNDTLYLRVDEELRAELEGMGCRPFTYTTKRGSVTVGRFVTAPDSCADDNDELLDWVRRVRQHL